MAVVYPSPDLESKWANVLRWIGLARAAQMKVFAEDGNFVPVSRLLAHMQIETGGVDKDQQGRPIANPRGATPGAPMTAHGLMQITPEAGVPIDWSKIYDPAYNIYLGAKTLSHKYNVCNKRSWVAASTGYFGGGCEPSGQVDNSHSGGYDELEYRRDLEKNLSELRLIGINEETTPDDVDLSPGKIGIPGVGAIADVAANTFTRLLVGFVGLVIVGLGLYRVVA